jgi:arylsulfatase A-like enzyme
LTSFTRTAALLLAVLGSACTSSCPGRTTPACGTDLLDLQGVLLEASVAGRNQAWVEGQAGKHLRLNDVARRVLPASPPSRLRYKVDVPRGSRLSLAAAITPETHNRPPVQFFVKVKAEDGSEQVLLSEVLDPINRPAHRRWVEFDVDLSKVAGTGRELILETTGYEQGDDPRRAFWGAPVIQAGDCAPPLTIVYLVDTLRADHTTPYGYARDTTPHLAQLAKDAVVFEAAIAHASWTKPSVASLMTSQLPGRHRAVQLRDKLDQGHLTLAEMLKSKGFSTGAVIANSVIYSQGVDFEQGFDVFLGMHGAEDRPSKIVEAGPVVDAALRFLDTRAGRPTFLYAHTMDPHVPYTPPPPFDRRYEPHPAPGHPGIDPRSDYKEPLDRERMIAQYDGEIAYGDQEFGRFVQGLKERGLYERALIVFMGDHGEEFLDHGKWLHGRSVFDELVRIPLIVKFPGLEHAGTRVAQQVQEVDVFPTVLAAMELPVPPPGVVQGHPLQLVLEDKLKERPAVSEISHRGIVAHAMRTGRDKYIQRYSPEEGQLYFDLVKDPKEQHDVSAQNRDRVRVLQGDVESAMVTNPFFHNVKVVGPGTYDLYVRTSGWLEGVQSAGLGTSERSSIEGNKRKLSLLLTPRAGETREVSFTIRPMGAPVFLEGTKNGKPLQPGDVYIAEDGQHPPALPLRLPDVEPVGEDEAPGRDNIFAPLKDEKPGLHVWLRMIEGREKPAAIDKGKCEELKALGYLDPKTKCE